MAVLVTAVLAASPAMSGCAVPDNSVHATVLESAPGSSAVAPRAAGPQAPAPSSAPSPASDPDDSGTAATRSTPSEPSVPPAAERIGRTDTRTGAGPRPTADSTQPDGTGRGASVTSGEPVTDDPAHSADPATSEAAGDPPPPDAWAVPLRERDRPSTEAVLDDAPVHGAVQLVTVRETDGRPVVDAVDAHDRDHAETVVAAALSDPEVLDVSVATTVRVQGTQDPYRTAQWALTRLSAEKVWAAQPGAGVKVAVLDTGVDAKHPDLAGVVLSGRDLVSGGNGHTDPNGHGTHVAGVIAATANNGLGVAGLAQGVRILPVRVLSANGAGTDADLANGIVWAVDRGAQVINLSVGAPDYSAAEEAAVAYAVQRGVVVVSAAGNMRAQGNPTIYPAAFPGVIGVGAGDTSDRPAAFSSTGSGVDLLAPGMKIVSTYPPNTYAYMDGTSMSAPHVSAIAALVRAAAPRATGGQVAAVLTGTARDLAPTGRDDASGYGMVRPLEALTLAKRLATGSASLPGLAAPATPTTLTVVSAPWRTAYRATARVGFRLTSNGRALSRAAVRMCVAVAPSERSTCLTRRTDATGRVWLAATAGGTLTISARFAGTASLAETASRPVLIGVLPRVGVRGGVRALSLSVNPVAPGTRVRLQRRVGSTWRSAGTRTLPSSGRVLFSRLTRGQLYRVAVPATDRTMAAVSSAVRIR